MKLTELKKGQQTNRHCSDVLIALRKIMRAIDLHSRSLSREYGVTGPQLLILQEIANRNGISITELGKTISLSQATVTDIISRLEKKQLVVKRRSEIDKRRVELFETGTCRALLEKAPPPLQERFVKRFSKLEEWEQLMILSALQRMVEIMAPVDLDASPILAAGPITQ
jgi:DNA-binding MarR family transcriptional regulator